jgi:hypothetical protein
MKKLKLQIVQDLALPLGCFGPGVGFAQDVHPDSDLRNLNVSISAHWPSPPDCLKRLREGECRKLTERRAAR